MSKPCTSCRWRKGGDQFARCRAPEKTYPAHVSGLIGKRYVDSYCTVTRELTGDLWCGPEGKWWTQRQWWRP